MTTKEFDGFHDGVQEATDIVWWLRAKAKAYRVLLQHDLADEFDEAAKMLHDAVGKIKTGYGAELENHSRSVNIHTSTMLATLLHFAGESKEKGAPQ